MSNNQETEKINKEELKKLEEAAYFELCQIIAEALQFQDIELLDIRIANWKKKYKKLLDSPYSANFKKKIEFLLNEYYSSVTQYILQQIRKIEHKKIEKQYKAMRKLYDILDNNKNIKTLKEKIKSWKEKYPVDAFLNMYQKKINSLTRNKNLENYAFDQDKAFYDLYRITKISGTIEELKEELKKWKEKYRINNKFKIDDFDNKHKSDVKRYVSNEYLQSIAKSDDKTNESSQLNAKPNDTVIEASDSKSSNDNYSDISTQDKAYKKLLSIIRKHNNVNEVFDWVYKNSSIKFNDKYKELILASTCIEYSPAFLTQIRKPNIKILDKSLTLDGYKNILELKRYAIISYFNLLLPKEQSIANSIFDSFVQELYYKAKSKESSMVENPMETAMEFGTEIKLPKTPTISQEKDENEIDKTLPIEKNIEISEEKISDTPIVQKTDISEVTIEKSAKENVETIKDEIPDTPIATETSLEISIEQPAEEKVVVSEPDKVHDEPKVKEVTISQVESETPIEESVEIIKEEIAKTPITTKTTSEISIEQPAEEKVIISESDKVYDEPKFKEITISQVELEKPVEENAEIIKEEIIEAPITTETTSKISIEQPAEEKVVVSEPDKVHDEPKVKEVTISQVESEKPIEENAEIIKEKIIEAPITTETTSEISIEQPAEEKVVVTEPDKVHDEPKVKEVTISQVELDQSSENSVDLPKDNKVTNNQKSTNSTETVKQSVEDKEEITESFNESKEEFTISEVEDDLEEYNDPDIISISHEFFETINNYGIQADLINTIDNTAEKYAEKDNSQREYVIENNKQ